VEYDPEWLVRVVDNRTLPIYRTLTAKLTKNKPLPSAQAQSKDENDIQAARAAVKLLGNHWTGLELDAKHPEMVSWLVATGNCFFKQFWNTKKGERIVDVVEFDAEAGLNLDGTPKQAQQVDFFLGDTDLLVRSPFNCYPEPGKTKLRDMRMFGDAEITDVDLVEELYGKKVEPEKDTRFVKVARSLEGTIRSGQLEETNAANSTTVKELYILPCKQFPRGLVFGWAGSTLLYATEECRELPFVHFGLIEIPGQFWYRGVIEDVIPIQRRWNSLLSKIEMHNDYYMDPPIVVDPSIIDPEEWTTEPGLLVEAKMPGADLTKAAWPVPVPDINAEVFKELEILDAQFELVPILNKVSYGKETVNAKSGVAINFLQEKDDDIIRPLIDQIEASYADVFKRDFALCQQNYDEDRGFAIVGEDNEVEWIEFTKANLEANIDVGVEPGSAMPRSKVAQQAMVMDMLQAGFFTDPRTGKPDYAKALKYMEFGSVDDIYEEAALDSNQAKRENERLKEGVYNEPEYWHNHEAHLYEHNRLRKTADYESYPPEIKQLFEMHIQFHEQLMQPTQQAMPQEQVSYEQTMAFLQQLQQQRPDLYNQVMSLPEGQREQALMQLMQGM